MTRRALNVNFFLPEDMTFAQVQVLETLIQELATRQHLSGYITFNAHDDLVTTELPKVL